MLKNIVEMIQQKELVLNIEVFVQMKHYQKDGEEKGLEIDDDNLEQFADFLKHMLDQLKHTARDAGNYLESLNITGPKEALFMMSILSAAAKDAKKNVPPEHKKHC